MSSILERLTHNPLTPIDGGAEPTPKAARLLRFEVYTNAADIESNLGGGAHGHMGLVMPPAEYLAMAGVPYVQPIAPPVPVFQGTAAAQKRQGLVYDEALIEYKETRALSTVLKRQILQAVPADYLEAISDPITGFTNVTPRQLVAHVIDTYGMITRDAIWHNRKALETPWDPDTPISKVFSNGTRCLKFALEGNNPISDMDYVQALVIVFRTCGVLDDAVKDWDKLPGAQQTVANAITHFTAANARRLEAKQHLKDVLAANTAAGSPPEPATALNASSLPPLPPAPPKLRGLDWGYCWSHGAVKHTSANCRFPKEGHIKTAHMTNRQGGSLDFPKDDDQRKKRKQRGRDRRNQGNDEGR
jgi:hypothetical protein